MLMTTNYWVTGNNSHFWLRLLLLRYVGRLSRLFVQTCFLTRHFFCPSYSSFSLPLYIFTSWGSYINNVCLQAGNGFKMKFSFPIHQRVLCNRHYAPVCFLQASVGGITRVWVEQGHLIRSFCSHEKITYLRVTCIGLFYRLDPFLYKLLHNVSGLWRQSHVLCSIHMIVLP